MISASQLAHAYVGRPAVEGCAAHEAEPCAVCGGESTRGKLVWEFIGSSLTDQTSFCSPHSDHVCEACVYVRARFSPVVGREPKPCDRCNGTGVEPSQAQARKGNRGHREPGQPCAKCDGTCRKESAGRWSNAYMLEFTRSNERPYATDPGTAAWLKARGLRYLRAWPAIVQHDEVKSLYGHNMNPNRYSESYRRTYG